MYYNKEVGIKSKTKLRIVVTLGGKWLGEVGGGFWLAGFIVFLDSGTSD